MKKSIRLSGAVFVSALVFVLAPAGASAEDSETEQLQEGQRKALIRVVSISGNELTYYEEEEETETGSEQSGTEGQTAEEQSESEEQKTEAADENDIPEEKAETETAVDGSGTLGTEPETENSAQNRAGREKNGNFDRGQLSGDNSEQGQTNGNIDRDQLNGENPNRGQMNGEAMNRGQMNGENFDPGQTKDGVGNPGRMGMRGRETTTVYLPVPVVVHTDTGEQMGFSILEAGDELEVLFQENEAGEEVIAEIWLKGVEDSQNEKDNSDERGQ